MPHPFFWRQKQKIAQRHQRHKKGRTYGSATHESNQVPGDPVAIPTQADKPEKRKQKYEPATCEQKIILSIHQYGPHPYHDECGK